MRNDEDHIGKAAGHRAFWDFSARIITPTVERLLPEPQQAHAVEIGYLDGALLVPASHYFGTVTGVGMGRSDDESTAAASAADAGRQNVSFTGWDPAGRLPFDDATADFIYSLDGVRRLPGLASFGSLVAECSRVLRPGGVAMLWFGRLSRLPLALPGTAWLRGHELRPDQLIGGMALHLRMFHVLRATWAVGMKAPSLSTPLHPDTSWRLFRGGGLSYVTAWKPR